MVIEAPGLGAERGPKCRRGVCTFRGYMQSKLNPGVWEARKASDGVSDALWEAPGSTSGSHLDFLSKPFWLLK